MHLSRITLIVLALTSGLTLQAQPGDGLQNHGDLQQLFADWRHFEHPPLRDGAPDYGAICSVAAQQQLGALRTRLGTQPPPAWPIPEQVDWHLLRAEMNGFDFNCRVLKPWTRDPAFYQTLWSAQSDVPDHEGPTNHAVLELWQYAFPLDADAQARMAGELAVIPALLLQARDNLTGNARDLWIAGIRDIRSQAANLLALRERLADHASLELLQAVDAASTATRDFVLWLEAQAPSKTGPSGIGRDDYRWYQMQVHYVPLDFEEETLLLRRELDRAWSSLALEEHRNRALPVQEPVDSAAAYDALVERTSAQMLRFFAADLLPMRDYMPEELVAHLGDYEDPDTRNFFTIVTHHDPRPLLSHFYHWFDLAEIRDYPHPSPLRQRPLLYNIFDSRNEGTATGVEEMFMHTGLYDDSPRSRELVWIMLAQRAARGLGSLQAHANEKTMAEAGEVHVRWTPRNWMRNEPELLVFEQHLYLRQPGYGTSYVTGKYLLERLLAARSRQMSDAGRDYPLSEFFRELRDAGSIPISLVHWELTGDDSDIQRIMHAQ